MLGAILGVRELHDVDITGAINGNTTEEIQLLVAPAKANEITLVND